MHVSAFIIQQIVTMPIYGKEALNICHLCMTDILRKTLMTTFGSALQIFFHSLSGGHFEKRGSLSNVFRTFLTPWKKLSTINALEKSTSIFFSLQRYPGVDLEFFLVRTQPRKCYCERSSSLAHGKL